MQVTELPAEGLKRAFQIVVPASGLAARRDKRLAELGAGLNLPGFRPGKVPAAVVKARYGAAVSSEVLEQSVEESTRQVLSDRGLRPAMQPEIEVVNYNDGGDLEFKVALELLPEIPMPDFSGMELERLKAKPGDAEIDAFLKTMADRLANLEDVAETRPAQAGDVLVCDFKGRVKQEDGSLAEPFPGGTAKEMPIEVAGEGFIPGFTEQLVGLSPGESRDLDVTFPAEYGSADLAGRGAVFAVQAKGLKRKVVPAVDEDFAKKLGMESVEQLRGQVAERLQGEYDGLTRMRLKRTLLDKLAEQASFTVPEGMVEAEFNQIWQRVEADMKAGKLDEDDKGKDEEALKAEYRSIAERRIRLGLLLSEIGRTNNIQVTPDEMSQALRREAARYPGQEKQVVEFFRKNPQAGENLRAPIFEEKVVDFVLELAKVTDREIPPAELQAAATA